jgi:YD repeat-containing protein
MQLLWGARSSRPRFSASRRKPSRRWSPYQLVLAGSSQDWPARRRPGRPGPAVAKAMQVSVLTFCTFLTDANSDTTQWGYDLYGRVTNKVDATSASILQYQYDADSRLTNRWSLARSNTVKGSVKGSVLDIDTLQWRWHCFPDGAHHRGQTIIIGVRPLLCPYIRLARRMRRGQAGFMPRQMRIEFARAVYHVMSRGDRREPIFLEEEDRRDFLQDPGRGVREDRIRHPCLLLDDTRNGRPIAEGQPHERCAQTARPEESP